MAKILITGGAGFIGSHTAHVLMQMGHQVTAYDSFTHHEMGSSKTFDENLTYRMDHLLAGVEIARGSLLYRDAARRLFLRVRPQYVIHLAALSSAAVASQQTEQAFAAILQATLNVLEIVREIDSIQKFVYASSSMVYGDFEKVPVSEDAPKHPKEIYGGMKLGSEILTKVYASQYQIPYAIVRPSAVYGPTNNNRSVLQVLVESAIGGQPFCLSNSNATCLDFTYVTDLAHGLALVTLAETAVNQELNLTRGEGRTLFDAVQIVRRHIPALQVHAKTDKDVNWPVRGALDISKAQRLVGYAPKYALEGGLAEYLSFVRERNPSLTRMLRATIGARRSPVSA